MVLIMRGGYFLVLYMLLVCYTVQTIADDISKEEGKARQSMERLEKALGQLALSDEQKQRIDEVISQNQRAMRGPYKKMLEAKKTLEKSGYVKDYNHQVVTQMAKQMAESIEKLQILQVTMQQQIFTRLTTEQQKQLLSISNSKQKRRYQ